MTKFLQSSFLFFPLLFTSFSVLRRNDGKEYYTLHCYMRRDQINIFALPILLLLSALTQSRKAHHTFTISVFLSLRPYVCPSDLLSARISMSPTGQNSAKFYICDFSENISRKYKFVQHPTKISGDFYKHLCTFHTVGSNVCSRTKNRRHCCGSKTKNTLYFILLTVTYTRCGNKETGLLLLLIFGHVDDEEEGRALTRGLPSTVTKRFIHAYRLVWQ